MLHSLSLFVITLLFNGCLGTNHLINLVHSCLQSFDTQILMEWLSYEAWQRLSNNMPVYFAYYADIMLDAFGYPLCFLLCWHNWPGPTAQNVPEINASNFLNNS